MTTGYGPKVYGPNTNTQRYIFLTFVWQTELSYSEILPPCWVSAVTQIRPFRCRTPPQFFPESICLVPYYVHSVAPWVKIAFLTSLTCAYVVLLHAVARAMAGIRKNNKAQSGVMIFTPRPSNIEKVKRRQRARRGTHVNENQVKT